MRKAVLCIVLSLLLLLPTLTACNKESSGVGTDAVVYTLYTICEEGTTEEAITEVELALNRILFYRLGIILKLEMVTADKYDELIAEKYAEVDEYQKALLDGEEVSVDETIITGDDILKKLENGEEIPLKQPRLDIFLVRGYDEYFELANKADIQELDTALDNYGKALKANIHSTLFDAAKISNKIYGVPVNHAIDQYTYLVFDKNYLNDINPNTISSLEDLEGYLAAVKASDPNVVPLKNVVPSNTISHLMNDGFPVIGNKTTALNAYKDASLRNYFALIARYNQMGYLGSEDDAEGTKYAVRFEKGDYNELKELYPDCEIIEYSAPIATNESVFSTSPDTAGNLFCISKFVAANEITDVMKLLNAINTDAELMNILLYGEENEHYILTEKDQVKRERQDYIIDPNNIGNAFIAKTLDGEDPEKWNKASIQNQEAIASYALGFSPSPLKFSYKEDGESIYVDEPDYFSVINEVVLPYYDKLMSGDVDFNYTEFYNTAKNKIFADIETNLRKHYEDNVLRPQYENDIREATIAQIGEAKKQEAKDYYMSRLFERTKQNWENNLYVEYGTKNPDKTEAEIAAMVAATLTDDFVNQKILEENKQSDIDKTINDLAETYINQAISDAISAMSSSAQYQADLNRLLSSQRYANELKELKMVAEQQDIPNEINKLIVSKIDEEIIAVMMEELEVALEEAVNTYFEENKELLFSLDDLDYFLVQIEYLVQVEQEIPEDSEETPEPVFEPAYESWFEFVYNVKILKVYTALKEAAA